MKKMHPEAESYFSKALAIPSPSGFEESIQRLNQAYIAPFADNVQIDVHGNLIAQLGTAGSQADVKTKPRLMYAGHCDQIGMLVSYIDEQGFVHAQTIGGWDPQQLIGQAMTIWRMERDANGDSAPKEIPAAISRKPIHLLSAKEKNRVVELDELWLDIGAKDQESAAALVKVGDPVTLDLRHRRLEGGKVCGPGTDNKTGMWTVIDSLRRVAQSLETTSESLGCQLHSVATVQEEIGLRGAKTAAGSVDPHVAIAVDVTHASDCPTISKNDRGDIQLGKGPVIFRGPNINRKLADRLVKLAEDHSIPYQIGSIARATPNDANVLQIHGGGVATGLVAIPNRYMHSAVEVISTEDIDHAAELLSLFALNLTKDCDFIPS